ncbi:MULTISPECIES: site-specific integrase [unclassified Mameliella]|uniref:tyrosine-type recombinase/integrase n=1 Tax=unclassified Mameliella TaxID=2630630 RepID=UPI00273EE618|nr:MULTISPECIES: site-specific integrase [unclassified Mameliella]
MPRPRKPARLYWRKDEQQWVIRDGTAQIRTGFGAQQSREAENALSDYLAQKAVPERSGPAHPGELTVGEVLAKYADDYGPGMEAPATLAYSIAALAPFWADLTCDAVKESECRRYQAHRDCAPGTVRRELGVLQAALNYAHREGVLVYPIKVKLPEAGAIRDRWLTRDELALLLRAAAPHVRKFILLSYYTGRRASAILELTWSRVDLERGVIRFREDGQRETNKRRGRIVMPRQLRSHIARWRAGMDALPRNSAAHQTHVVMFRGQTVASIKKGIRRAAERAGLDGVTPHVLKHTSITHAIMSGLGIEDAAEYFDTSPATIREHYWHHSPHQQAAAVQVIERRGR